MATYRIVEISPAGGEIVCGLPGGYDETDDHAEALDWLRVLRRDFIDDTFALQGLHWRSEDPSEPVMEPGPYSAFVLDDDSTWIQPTFHVPAGHTEHDVNMALLAEFPGFLVAGLQTDPACPEDDVRHLSDSSWPTTAESKA